MNISGNKVMGFLQISRTRGIAIYNIENNGVYGYVVAGYMSMSAVPKTYKLSWGQRGAYFNFKRKRYYLADFRAVG